MLARCHSSGHSVTGNPAMLCLNTTFQQVDRGVAITRRDSACVSLVNAIARETSSLQGYQEEAETRQAVYCTGEHTYSVLLSAAGRSAVTYAGMYRSVQSANTHTTARRTSSCCQRLQAVAKCILNHT